MPKADELSTEYGIIDIFANRGLNPTVLHISMNRKYFVSLIFLVIGFICFSQIPNKKSQNCFSKLEFESGFIAITTSKDSDLANWYRQNFGMEQVKEFTSANGNSSGIILRKDKFVLEILFRNKLIERKQFRPGAQNEEWDGLLKFGVYTNADLLVLKQCLLERGVNAGRIFRDDELGEDLLLVKDPEGNMMELISRSSIPQR
ncbi:hypothetical protein NE848_00075 [Gramella jeungdoensis]|uniref:VOC domain-containing protein n=1 Tax=Gramella jeungdoensis TaxID=708091 RepID=A0ABT0YW93_9FLAO|nr:hypothetical protein [Gramella jeungdoensis]MCM8567758.1 hypothetical protein [Gramella jeungdoensis]